MIWRLSYRLIRAVSALQYHVQRRSSRAGLFVLGGIAVSGALGVDTTQTYAYQLFTLLCGLTFAALLGLPFMRVRVEARRVLPRAVTAGESFSYAVHLRNTGDVPTGNLALIDNPADPRPPLDAFRRLRFPTYRGYWRLTRARQICETTEAQVADIAAQGEAVARIEAVALRRGMLHLDSLTVARHEPLSLFRGLATTPAPENLLVLPKRYAIPPLALPGARRYQSGGVSLATSVGDSEEFVGLRDYRPGDPLQRVHWKSFARAGRPVVKEYHDEFFERHALVLDTFGAAADATENTAASHVAFEEAVSVAASFAYTIDTQECLLDLLFVGDAPCVYTTGRGQMQPVALLEALAGARLRADADFGMLEESLLARRATLTSAILVLLDWDERRQALVRALRAIDLPLMVLAVMSERPADAPSWLRVLVPGKIAEGLARL